MSKFCPNCGEKQDNESSKFCPNCGANLSVNSDKTKVNKSNNSIKCMYCGSDIPIVSDKCFKCGKYLNPAANEKHTAVIVIGYICSFIPFVSLISFIILCIVFSEQSSLAAMSA